MKTLKWIGAFVAGIIGGSIFMLLLHNVSGLIFPEAAMSKFPEDPELIKAFMDSLGVGPKLAVVFSHWGGAMVGSALSMMIAPTKKIWPGVVIGGWFLIGGIANASMIPMPLWMMVLDLLGYIPVAYLAAHWMQRIFRSDQPHFFPNAV